MVAVELGKGDDIQKDRTYNSNRHHGLVGQVLVFVHQSCHEVGKQIFGFAFSESLSVSPAVLMNDGKQKTLLVRFQEF